MISKQRDLYFGELLMGVLDISHQISTRYFHCLFGGLNVLLHSNSSMELRLYSQKELMELIQLILCVYKLFFFLFSQTIARHGKVIL